MLQTTNSKLDINYVQPPSEEVLWCQIFHLVPFGNLWRKKHYKMLNAVFCYGSRAARRARDRALQSPRPGSGSGDWRSSVRSLGWARAGTGAGIVYAFVLLGETRVQDLTALKTKLNQTAQNCASQRQTWTKKIINRNAQHPLRS